ncbi:50S ribosomal protein L22 [Candidatus Poribacteria bacterium]|nr:50S ribosomal protein L22 [Candidatus Poribacteria bacterium]
MRAKAKGSYVRITARKMRLVADLIRGKRVDEALQTLKYTPKKAAEIVEKILLSSVANASLVKGVNIDNLIVASITVDGGPIIKRFMTRSMGRASSIKKRTAHITICVGEN